MSAAWSLQTRSGAVRLSPVPIPLPPSCVPLEPRPFPPPALPRFPGTTGLSATPNGPACPSQAAGGHAPCHRQGFPCCVHPPPPCVPPPLPRRNRSVLVSLASRPMTAFPLSPAGRLPHHLFRRLLDVHPRCGPQGRRVAFATRLIAVLQSMSLPPSMLRLLPAGATVAGRDSQEWRLRTAHCNIRATDSHNPRRPSTSRYPELLMLRWDH